MTPRYARIIRELPAAVPFVPPEAIERRTGKPVRVRIGANESVFGISPRAIEAMRGASAEVMWYGDPESYDLRARLSEIHGVGMDRLVVAAGIDDLLGMVVRCFVEPGEPVVASRGSYPTFVYHVKAYGAELHGVPYAGDYNDVDGLIAEARRARAKIVYLANPDNPTGTLLLATDVARLVDALPEGAVLVLDEAYSDFVGASDLLPVTDDPRVVRVRTFSKAHGMAGARIGYAIASADTIAAFEKFRLHFGVNRVAQAGALASLGDREFIARVVADVAEGRVALAEIGRSLGLRPLPSSTNFVSFDLEDGARAKGVLARLLDHGVFVRVGAPPNDKLLRVTVGRAKERDAFGEALRAVL